ncbi:putative histidine kinase HHK4p [Corynespora cassiicola Philippines]|uniref:histidine kinase n=1 Tax=Corynespora cassiicola Philippines TaxID=1448308 RepID=A0A2T2P7I8_CORCC|nr:putative histidine kinase HHK4p [Corynespora cassiicola Philippines]
MLPSMADHATAPAGAPSYAATKKQLEQADRAKEREFYRYYHPSQRPKSDASCGQHDATPDGRPNVLPSLAYPATPACPKPSEDKALTAFAQLGALRLNARRCLISFFDRRNCHILAEATRTLSLDSDRAEYAADRLCWGASIFPKEKSICYYTVNLPVILTQPFEELGHVPSLVVNDLSQDDRFKNYPFVLGPPYARFYAAVPIRSPTGHSIGTYSVLDDKPRNGLSEFELSFMKDMSATIMKHLEMTRATDDHKRGGIMIRSLGSFAEGKSSLEEWSDPWDPDLTPSTLAPADTIFAPRQRRLTASNGNAQRPVIQDAVFVDRKNSVDSSVPSMKSPHPTSPSTAPPGSVVVTPASEIVSEHRPHEVAKKASSTKNDVQDRVAPEVRAAFSRAASMIVDSTDAEGAVFFDAQVSTFGGLVDDDFLSEPPEPDKPCTILGAALCKHVSTPLSPSSNHYSMSESVLRYLLRTYSHGQIFNFDAEAAPASHTSPGETDLTEFPFNASRRSESSKSQEDENLLRDVFPKARSLVLYPLWDPHRDRWFASVIIWSSDPMRVFTSEQELSYLAAFSNSVMAEVARLDTKLADAAKADFISSISHELRSPLHGILGMADLLKETKVDTQQSNMTKTIETCGKTLLDTINHVLDFAKINNLTRGASKRSKKRSQSAKHVINPGQGHTNDIMTVITDVDMSVLAEEALESVFAGYHFQQTATQTFEQPSKKPDIPPIAIVLDINKTANYVFRTQPGAWRRIIMNLFGNSLKYTPAGYIKVKLQVVPSADEPEDVSEFRVIITDSGIGMSEDYVNHRLFHSFAQENPLSQGTGLGLSIVKQLVDSLGGDIEVRSEKGRGTKFTVYCPLKTSIMSPAVCASIPERELLAVNKRTEGMRVSFVGFEDEDEYFPVKSLKNKNATMLTLKALDNMCSDWFGMEGRKHEPGDRPDIFVSTESGAKWLREQHSKHPDTASTAPVVVVCQGAASAQSTTAITVPGQVFECIVQPCGPHKFARALTSCLDRHSSRVLAHAVETDTTLSKVSTLSLKENTPPISPNSLATVLEPTRPPISSTLSAPEVRSVNSSPVKKLRTPPHRALNCLAVDDNPINLRLLRTFVEKLGHRHVLAKNGLEALNTYKDSCVLPHSHNSTPTPPVSPAITPHIDVILMDINMPEMDGLEATRQIRSYERDHDLPPVTIIALTGVASSEAQQEAHVSGVNLFLIKPVRLADLEVVLKGVITGDETSAEAKKEEEGGEEAERLSHQKSRSDGLIQHPVVVSLRERE